MYVRTYVHVLCTYMYMFLFPSSGDRSFSQSAKDVSPAKPTAMPPRTSETFNPFCTVDQVELSIHCHINAVKCLLSVPGVVPMDLCEYLSTSGVCLCAWSGAYGVS